ncbi:MAG: hypothetical protein LBK26_02450 [Rickettsiales bacterium]|nr:hypothetical protein [Rickettsiales bacterium]
MALSSRMFFCFKARFVCRRRDHAARVGLWLAPWLNKRKQYKKLIFACIVGAILSAAGVANADTDDIGDYYYGGVCENSYCLHYTSEYSVNENEVEDCNGYFNETLVPKFKVGGYCSPSKGKGNYDAPEVQDCDDCSPATSRAGEYCYCKIHSLNDVAVASSRFVFNDESLYASVCASMCTNKCTMEAWFSSGFRAALFSALGS